MTEHRKGRELPLNAHDIAEFHNTPVTRQDIGGNGRGQGALIHGFRGFRQSERDGNRLAATATMRIANCAVGIETLQRIVDIAFLDLVVFEVVLVDRGAHARHLLAEAVIDVDDERYLGKGLTDFLCCLTARFRIGAIDLGEQSGHHRRARRRLDNLERGARLDSQRSDLLAEFKRDVVAAAVAIALARQRDLHIAQLR